MDRFPDMKRYTYNKTHVTTFTSAWGNGQFGGSAFKPLGSYTKNKLGKMVASKRTRINQLGDNVKKMKVMLPPQDGCYFQIMKVQQFKENSYQFYDIYLLTDNVANREHLELFKKATAEYKDSLKLGKKNLSKITTK